MMGRSLAHQKETGEALVRRLHSRTPLACCRVLAIDAFQTHRLCGPQGLAREPETITNPCKMSQEVYMPNDRNSFNEARFVPQSQILFLSLRYCSSL